VSRLYCGAGAAAAYWLWHGALSGTIGSPPRLVRDVLLRVGRAFARDGFRWVVVISGHLGMSHLLAMETAAQKVSRRYGVTMIAPVASVWRSALSNQALVEQSAELPEPITGPALEAFLHSHHAGALETSLMLHVRPELVQPEFRQLERIGVGRFLRWRGWTREQWPGYVGEPALARADFGRVMLATIASQGANLIARAVRGDVLAHEEVAPLTRGLGRTARRGSLVFGVVGVAGGLAGFCFRLRRRGRLLRVKNA